MLNRGKTHCIRGHVFDEANTYLTREGARQCRTCERARHRRQKAEMTKRDKAPLASEMSRFARLPLLEAYSPPPSGVTECSLAL